MLIRVRHAPPFRRWHQRLGERLEAVGHSVSYEAAGQPVGRYSLAIERRLYGIVADWDAPEPPLPAGEGVPGLTIALAGELDASGLVLRPEIDDAFGEVALLAAARAGTAPHITILGGAPDALRPLVCGRPAIGDPLVLARALEDLLPRLVTLLVQAVARLECAESASALDEVVAGRRVAVPAFLARGLRHKLARRLGSARGRPAHWRLALRRDGEAAFCLLADDASRFRADPFLFEDFGRLWLFYEEYHYATGKGVIGCLAVADPLPPSRLPHTSVPEAVSLPLREEGSGVEVLPRFSTTGYGDDPRPPDRSIEKHGTTSTPDPSPQGRGKSPVEACEGFVEQHAPACLEGEREAHVVLDEGFHLSYPLVLRHDGAIYMLPEMSAAARVQLYRTDAFPDRWLPDAVLLEDRRLADATPILHEGLWWLFATAADDGSSSWDQLHLFHAPDLLGPWVPHAGNPVLIDAGAARPAGHMWHQDGVLMRPTQDCRRGYGDGIAICRVDRLDPGGYRQTVVQRIGPPPGATGIHTLARAAGWGAVDLRTPHPKP